MTQDQQTPFMPPDQALPPLTPGATFRLVAFNIVLAVVLTTTLVCLIARAPSSPPKGPAPADSTIVESPDQDVVSQPRRTAPSPPPDGAISDAAVRQSLPLALVTTLITMVIAGGAGGTLCNLRGIFRWVSETGSFPARYATPFYVRPFTGAMTGLFAFFVGHLFVTSLSEGPANPDYSRASQR